MISDSRLQFMLSQSPSFLSRLQAIMAQIALEVSTEQNVGSSHALRFSYAQRVLANPSQAAISASVVISQSTNVRGTIELEDEGIKTTVTDGALASQVASLWNVLSGVDQGS